MMRATRRPGLSERPWESHVRILLLPSSVDGTPQQFLTTLLVNDTVTPAMISSLIA